MGPVGVSLAETITVLDAAQLPSASHSSRSIEVGPNDAARVRVMMNEGAGAQPDSSDTSVLSASRNVTMSMQAELPNGDCSADTLVSVQVVSSHDPAELDSRFPPPVVSAATGTAAAAMSRTRPAHTPNARLISTILRLAESLDATRLGLVIVAPESHGAVSAVRLRDGLEYRRTDGGGASPRDLERASPSALSLDGLVPTREMLAARVPQPTRRPRRWLRKT